MNMDEKNNERSIRDKVLGAIKSGKTTMRPRWHFILKGTLLAIGALLLGFLLLFLVSFIVFSMRQTGAWFAPVFGAPGWFTFLRHVPWVLIALSILFIVVLEILVRHYSFTYRKPLLYSVLAIIFIAVIVGIYTAPFHRGFFVSVKFIGNRPPPHESIPFLGDFYRNFGLQRFDDVRRGSITAMVPGGFSLESLDGETSTILISSGTRLFQINGLENGDTVIVFGEENNHSIQAAGIMEVQE